MSSPILLPVAFLIASSANPPPVVSATDPCGGSPGLPAISADGSMIAALWCWSDVRDAHDRQLHVIRAKDGKVMKKLPLSRADVGGRNATKEDQLKVAATQANLTLTKGKFHSLVALP